MSVAGAGTSPWITVFKPQPSCRLRIFCFAHAGAGASVFRPWAALAPAGVEIAGVQLPGRENRFREPCLTESAVAIPALGAALKPRANLPFILFGHSLGAALAFELAHWLGARGAKPKAVVLSGRPAPQSQGARKPLHQLDDADFRDALARMGGMPGEVLQNRELMTLLLPILRADVTLSESIRASGPLDCPLVALAGDEDTDATPSTVAGWRDWTTAAFRLERFPGDHFFVYRAQQAVLDIMLALAPAANTN